MQMSVLIGLGALRVWSVPEVGKGLLAFSGKVAQAEEDEDGNTEGDSADDVEACLHALGSRLPLALKVRRQRQEDNER